METALCRTVWVQLKFGRRVLLIRLCAERAPPLRRYCEVVVDKADGALATDKAGLGGMCRAKVLARGCERADRVGGESDVEARLRVLLPHYL